MCFQEGQKEKGPVHRLGLGNDSKSFLSCTSATKRTGGIAMESVPSGTCGLRCVPGIRSLTLQEQEVSVSTLDQGCRSQHRGPECQLTWPRRRQGKLSAVRGRQLLLRSQFHPDCNWRGGRETPSQPRPPGKAHLGFGMDVESTILKCAIATHSSSPGPVPTTPQ